MNGLLTAFNRWSPAGHRISGADYDQVVGQAAIGDILIGRTDLRIYNVLIPGYWGHVGIWDGEKVVEAVPPRVKETHPVDFCMRYRNLGILRVVGASTGERYAAVANMDRLIGQPYDFGFEPANGAFYCSEAVYESYKAAVPWLEFERRKRFGRLTVTPQDLWNAERVFQRVMVVREPV